jgi:hypothetical protein
LFGLILFSRFEKHKIIQQKSLKTPGKIQKFSDKALAKRPNP